MPRTTAHVAGTALLITLGLAMPVYAGHHEGGHKDKAKMDPAAYVEKLTTELGLSKEQTTKVSAIVTEHHGKIQGVKDQIKALKEQIKPLKEQKKALKEAKYNAIKAVLTPEQQVKFAEMKAKKRDHHKHGKDCGCAQCALKQADTSGEE